MSDKCEFTQADEGMCSSHNLPAALCTHAAAALDGKAAYLEGQVKDDGWTIAHLAARIRELQAIRVELQATATVLGTYLPGRALTLPHDLAVLLGLKLEKAEARVQELEAEIEEMKDDAKHTAWERDLL